ncbi:MAG: hypothetical protein AB7P03_26190 [Kofleriaceae bacterium]
MVVLIGCGGGDWRQPTIHCYQCATDPENAPIIAAAGAPIELSMDWEGSCEQVKELRVGTVDSQTSERCAHRPFKANVRCVGGSCTIAPAPTIDSSSSKVLVTPVTAGDVTLEVVFDAGDDTVTRTRTLRVVKPDRLELACDTSTDPPALPKTTFTVYSRVWAGGMQVPAGANVDIRVIGATEPCVRVSHVEYECPQPAASGPLEVHGNLDGVEASLRGTFRLGRCVAGTP